MEKLDSPQKDAEDTQDVNPIIKRGRVDSVNLYEVKENELEILEKGSSATLQFNFAIFLFSIAFACIVALVTCEFKWETMESIFLFVSIIGVLLGTYMIISWRHSRKSIRNVILTIRNRIDQKPSQMEDTDLIRILKVRQEMIRLFFEDN